MDKPKKKGVEPLSLEECEKVKLRPVKVLVRLAMALCVIYLFSYIAFVMI